MRWWQEAVFYQVYPLSFKDSDGDGFGDLRGIVGKLDYLNDGKGGGLGVDALWISPFWKSPMRDWGYDVASYDEVDPVFGDMEAFRDLVDGAHARGMKVVLDLVVNHTSDRHPWFAEARGSKDDPRHDWYLWAPIKGRKKPNNWVCLFTLKSAWVPNPATGEYYLGTFTPDQPELNWRNPEVKDAVYGIMRKWLDFGVDGYRLDVCTAYVKDAKLRSNPPSHRANPELFQRHVYDRNRPEVAGIFREMRALADSYPGERVLVGEAHGHDPKLAASCALDGEGLHMAFNFDFLHAKWGAGSFRKSAERWYAALGRKNWPNFTLSNHDQSRAAFRYRSDDPEVTDRRCRILAMMLLTLRGTPFVYYGEEIGMTCERIRKEALRDPLGKATWPLAFVGRDPERTPMQWSAKQGGGFTSGHPWLPLNSDWKTRNVAAQEADPQSLLSFWKSAIRFRKARRELVEGTIEFVTAPRGVLLYRRRLRDSELWVALNMSRWAVTVPVNGTKGAVLLETVVSSTAVADSTGNGHFLRLQPWSGAIVG